MMETEKGKGWRREVSNPNGFDLELGLGTEVRKLFIEKERKRPTK